MESDRMRTGMRLMLRSSHARLRVRTAVAKPALALRSVLSGFRHEPLASERELE